MATVFEVRDEAWEVVESLLSAVELKATGRPRVGDRVAFNAIVFVLVTGIAWHETSEDEVVTWPFDQGVVELPDGARLRGRGLRKGAPPEPNPEWSLFLLGKRPVDPGWPHRWVRWPDFRLPADGRDARSAFIEAHCLAAEGVRVEIACSGGRGRTGTALACIAQLGGVGPGQAIAWVRYHYDPHAVETPWQRRFVRRFARSAPTTF